MVLPMKGKDRDQGPVFHGRLDAWTNGARPVYIAYERCGFCLGLLMRREVEGWWPVDHDRMEHGFTPGCQGEREMEAGFGSSLATIVCVV